MDAPLITIERDDGLGSENPVFPIDGGDWWIEKDGLENFDGLDFTVSSADYVQYDGAYLLAERAGAVDRTIEARSRLPRAEARRQAEAFFLSKRRYLVHVVHDGRARYCEGRQYALRIRVSPEGTQALTWTFLALDPYWLSEDEKRFDLAAAVRKRGFSHLSWSGRQGPTTGLAHVGGFIPGYVRKEIWLENAGSATAYPRFDVTAHGPVANPVITIVDEAGAELMRVALKVDLREGDEFSVDFSRRPTTITLNGANASHLVRPGSTLATGIEPGRFMVKWSADSGDAALKILPSIRERYVTV